VVAYLAEKCPLFQAKEVVIKQNLCSHSQTPFLCCIHVERFVVLCAPFAQIKCPVNGKSNHETRETTEDKARRESQAASITAEHNPRHVERHDS